MNIHKSTQSTELNEQVCESEIECTDYKHTALFYSWLAEIVFRFLHKQLSLILSRFFFNCDFGDPYHLTN